MFHELLTISKVMVVVTALIDTIVGGAEGLFYAQAAQCNETMCPGSAYNLITASWANIAYMTHADFLHLINDTSFGAWAPLLYVVGAAGALISVAINNPPRNYMWFLLGPALFNFLEFTTTPVIGVAWKVAGQIQPMEEVWKDAETGLANTALVAREGISVKRSEGPTRTYEVSWAMVFFDRLLSATTDGLIQWIGVGRQMGDGGADSNLARKEGNGEGPWYILADLKWPMLENIAGASARDPDVRDALVSFLSSECGDHFKDGIASNDFIAAMQSKGSNLPTTVLKGQDAAFSRWWDGTGNPNWPTNYADFVIGMDTEVIPTPRSIVRLLRQKPEVQGDFTAFSKHLGDEKRFTEGRTTEIVCSELLYVIIQALRWEAGHAYWQLLRSAPKGFSRQELLKSLFYGWDVRKSEGESWADNTQLENFVKDLILVYMLRNELLYAPSPTAKLQRSAPSEQAVNYSQSYVATQGSKSKGSELYNWAVMMPHVQGILLYLVLIFYPFAAMILVIPGYWKAFFTWISFFAWVKLWDVGFAIVHTLERSVWAMIGNNSSMARVANQIITNADKVGSIDVGKSCASGTTDLSSLCAVPDVVEQQTLDLDQIWGLFDRILLLTGGSADLGVSTGYYVYIMSALYFAVPTVAGQLVLGAKAGMANLATQAFSSAASEAGASAKSAAVGDAVNKLTSNANVMGAGTMAKSHRQTGLAMQSLQNANAGLDAELMGTQIGAHKNGLMQAADAANKAAASYGSNSKVFSTALGGAGETLKSATKTKAGTGAATGGVIAQALGVATTAAGATANIGLAMGQNTMDQAGFRAGVRGNMYSADAEWRSGQAARTGAGLANYGQKLGSEAEFTAQTAAWEARNEFAANLAGIGGVSGMNPGNLASTPKPTEMTGMAMTGQLGGAAQSAARYSGNQFISSVNSSMGAGRRQFGSGFVNQNWGGGFDYGKTARQAASSFSTDVGKAAEGLGIVNAIKE